MRQLLTSLFLLTLLWAQNAFCAFGLQQSKVPAQFKYFKVRQIQTKDINFNYSSADGEIQLKCDFYFAAPELHDWNVWCGKGTALFRTFRVHLLFREYRHTVLEKSAYEVLYWVTDRDQPIQKAFSSTSSWLEFNNISSMSKISLSQGVENDYALLTMTYQPPVQK